MELDIPTSGEYPPLPTPAHPAQGTPTALGPDDLPHRVMRAHDVVALLDKEIG